MRHVPSVLIAACLALVSATPLLAAPIIYSMTSVGYGTLGEVEFHNVEFTITATGETAHQVNVFPGVFQMPVTATVSVPAIGAGAFMNPLIAVVNWDRGLAGISDLLVNREILFVQAECDGHDLTATLGPLTGPTLHTYLSFPTTAGRFSLTHAASSAFVARVVPEPFWGLSVIVAAVGLLRLRLVNAPLRCTGD